MARGIDRLSAVTVKKLSTVKGTYCDGGGLYLRVNPPAQCSWVFRYMLHGIARWMGLGAYPLVSLADARARASDARRLLLDKLDPIGARRDRHTRVRLEAATRITFAECKGQYIAAHKASWKNAKHRQQWESTLKMYADSVIGTLPVSAVDTAMVLKALQPIWNEKPETAKRLRGRIEAILDYATVAGYRTGPNPARWRGHPSPLHRRRTDYIPSAWRYRSGAPYPRRPPRSNHRQHPGTRACCPCLWPGDAR